jgi:uracil-DNA glycosylase family 4
VEPKAPHAKCDECPLKDERFVPSLIPEGRPLLAVVGEAPGFQETAYKEPFKGPSGKLLDKVLNYVGFERKEVMYTNVVLCRPEDNATPPAAAQAACRGRLIRELTDSAVRDVVALGGTATNALIDDPRTITSLRVGPPKNPTAALRDSSVERVVATWHPAYCLRNADAFPTLVSDIEKVTQLAAEPWQEPEWEYWDEPLIAVSKLDELLAWQKRTGKYELVIDIEVGIEKDTSFDHPNLYQMLCLGLGWKKGHAAVVGENAMANKQVIGRLMKLLRRSKLIAQNGKFDLAGLYPLIKGLKLWFDTMLAHYALDERSGGHGLKILAVERLGAPAYDDEIKQYVPRGGSYAQIPREILYKYNALDIACTWDLYELFVQEMDADPVATDIRKWPYPELPVKTLRDWHDFLVAASNQLMFLELNGIAVDVQYNTELSLAYVQKLGDMEDDLSEIVKFATNGETETINPRSPKQVKEFLYNQGIRVEGTDKNVLAGLQSRLSPESYAGQFVDGLLAHRYEAKRYGTFVKGIRQRLYAGRVYTNYLLHGTTSGRLASRNPNLQNIVRDKAIRRQFVASKPGNILIQADYKQAEGRVIAWLAQDQYLRDIFASDEDLFNSLGAGLYKEKFDSNNKEQRVRTKAFFYGIAFGREYYSIAQEYKIPLNEAQRDYEAFLATIPATVAWQASIKKHVLDGEDLISPFGRRRRFALITPQNEREVFNEALSYLPQSTASDICLTALGKIRPQLRGTGYVRLTIHDALVVEASESKLDYVSELLRHEMVEAARSITTYVPFEVDVSHGPSWGDL